MHFVALGLVAAEEGEGYIELIKETFRWVRWQKSQVASGTYNQAQDGQEAGNEAGAE